MDEATKQATRYSLELFGQWVADTRKAEGLTQKQLGKLAGLHQSEIAKIERGKLNLTWLSTMRVVSALKSRWQMQFLPDGGALPQQITQLN